MLELIDGILRRVKGGIDDAQYLRKMEEKGLNEDGSALVPDPVPMEPPIGFVKQPSMAEYVRNMIRSENLRVAALESGFETFEESDDFDIPDDPVLPETGYEVNFDPPVAVEEPQKPKVSEPAAPSSGEPAKPVVFPEPVKA